MENPWPLSPFLVKKRQFCQNYSTFWVHKVNKIPLFSDVFQKNQRSHAHILSKNYLFSKNTLFLCPYFVKKTSILTKNIVLTLFFQIFAWKTSCFHTHIKSKNFNSVKTKLYYGPKKSIGCSLFLILRENYCSNALFWNVHSLKIICSNAHILS